MSTKSSRVDDLGRVRRRLDEWRRTRAYPRAPIPNTLWACAVRLAREHGLYRTARALRVDYGGLKRHVDAANGSGARSAFVELPPPPARGTGECVIELTGPRATVHIRLAGLALADVAALSWTLVGADA